MSKTKSKIKKLEEIRVEIISVRPYGFYMHDFESKDNLTKDGVEFGLVMKIGHNIEKQLVTIDIENDCYYKAQNSKKKENIFGIKSSTLFRVIDFDKLLNEKGEFSPPEDFIRKLLNICIGGIRGMISIKLMNTQMNDITFPLVDLSKFEN
ncbi:hypothetical protein [Aureibaculum luteum]|uniref:hypothetical protein n=1 Tax=Aureibaculum luteum TaxID=1548456 RepID=UPI0013005D87|nr:hypothetical protein [Aureibaculum luteum]